MENDVMTTKRQCVTVPRALGNAVSNRDKVTRGTA